MFSRVGWSAPQSFDATRGIHKHLTLPTFLYQIKKIKREDEDNENDIHRLMYSRVGRWAIVWG